MLTASQRSKPLLSSLLVLGFCVWWGDAIRCYVCGPIEDNKFNQTCEDFHLNISHYEQECPQNYFGCYTSNEGAQSKRECVRMRMNDCKSANNVHYCFCSFNLCNGLGPQAQSPQNPQLEDTDDEDILDEHGSGEGKPTANDKNNINVVIEDVGGNTIETEIETKTSSAAMSYIALYLLASAVFITCN